MSNKGKWVINTSNYAARSEEEIAALLGISRKNVAMALQTGMRKLRARPSALKALRDLAVELQNNRHADNLLRLCRNTAQPKP